MLVISDKRSRGRLSAARRSVSAAGRSRGISLIEVLVSVVIIAIGLLGIAAMQSVALRGGQSSLESSQAVMQTTSIIESMRANRDNATAYNGAMHCSSPGGGSLAQNDISAWIDALKSTVGTGRDDPESDTTTCGQITGCPDHCVITVQWDDQRGGGGATRQVVTETVI